TFARQGGRDRRNFPSPAGAAIGNTALAQMRRTGSSMKGDALMSSTKLGITTAIGLTGMLLASQAHAQSAGNNDQEITLLRQQLRLMEQKLDKLQRQTAANTTAAAKASAKADDAKASATVRVANANA